MAKKKFERSNDFLTFSGTGERANPVGPDRDLAAELYRKNWQAQTIDSFEKAQGFRTTQQEKPKLIFKNRIFDPTFDKDRELLNELMNNPKFSIVYRSETWTQMGELKMFIIYSENLDLKDAVESKLSTPQTPAK